MGASGWFVVFGLLALTSICYAQQRYRFCVVEALNSTRKETKYCPLLNSTGSRAVCVIANSRLDCLHLISTGKADFAVFEAEDIQVAAESESSDVVITNSVRFFSEREKEYEVVAIVRNSANIKSLADLKGKTFCHPGRGYHTDWNDVMARFFESRVVPQQCDSSMTLLENAIKSTSEYFGAACIAGHWSPNELKDSELKEKYPNLCSICDNPSACTTFDKYWGRTGPLFCLTDQSGDVAWARLDDAMNHFGFVPGIPQSASPDDYSFLCKNGTVVSMSDKNHCSWISRPWPAIMARREVAEAVQKLVSLTTNTPTSDWLWGLQYLLNSVQQVPVPVKTIMVPEDFLATADGFRSAYSVSHCDPDRNVRLCTVTQSEYIKCSWLRKAASVYGIEPELRCIKMGSSIDCLKGLKENFVDAVIINPDENINVYKQFGVKPILFEYSSLPEHLYLASAITKADSGIKSLADLKGKRACFPKYNGIGWNSFLFTMKKKNLLPKICPYENAATNFFASICAPGAQDSNKDLVSLCKGANEEYAGDSGAFHCLASGKGDVAFISLNAIKNNTDEANMEPWAKSLKSRDFSSLCQNNSTETCFLSWSTLGQLIAKSEIPNVKEEEIKQMFLKMSMNFGKHLNHQLPIIQLFGPFDNQKNLLFKDTTETLEDLRTLTNAKLPNNFEEMYEEFAQCSSTAAIFIPSVSLILMKVVFQFWTS